MANERGLFADPVPSEQRTECRVAVPDSHSCYALATSFRALADQLHEQKGRRFTKIRLDPDTRMIVVGLAEGEGGTNG